MSVEGELRRLDASTGWFSRGKRRAALKSLAVDARMGNPEALVGLRQRRELSGVTEVLLSVNPAQVARAWWQTRHPVLAEWVLSEQLLAEEPVEARVATALKTGRWNELLLGPDQALAVPLLSCAEDPELKEQAGRILENELPPELEKALLEVALQSECSPQRRALVAARGRLPEDLPNRVVFLLLTGREKEAEALDPEGELLSRAVLSAGQRSLVLSALRRQGRGQVVTALLGMGRSGPDLESIDRSWSELCPELLGQNRLEELWRLAFLLHLDRSRQILRALHERDFQPTEEERTVYHRALELAVRPRPEPQPLGRFPTTLDWAEDRLFVREGNQLICLDWQRQERLWTRPPGPYPLEGVTASPDGRWAGVAYHGEYLLEHLEGFYALLDSQGQSVWSEDNQAVAFGFNFSPCSRWLCLYRSGRGENTSDYEEFWSLESLNVVIPRRLATVSDWSCISGQLFVQDKEGWLRLDLVSGETSATDIASDATRISPDGATWTCWDGNQALVCRVGLRHPLPRCMQAEFLRDGRLVLADFDHAALWDGARLYQKSQASRADSVFSLDARGLRIVLSREERTELMRLSDDETYRSFPGKFVRLHPTRSYLITELEGEHCVWWAPDDLWLGRVGQADLDELEQGRRLEEGDRELAVLLAQHRLRHEISLEAHLPVSRHDIELDG